MMATASMNMHTSMLSTDNALDQQETDRFPPMVEVFHVLARNGFTQEERKVDDCSDHQQGFRVSAMQLVVETSEN
jgi:hypothetical protein